MVYGVGGLSDLRRETLTGTAAASGTHKRALLIVDGKRYELQPLPPPSGPGR
jgi:hypothetical protein